MLASLMPQSTQNWRMAFGEMPLFAMARTVPRRISSQPEYSPVLMPLPTVEVFRIASGMETSP